VAQASSTESPVLPDRVPMVKGLGKSIRMIRLWRSLALRSVSETCHISVSRLSRIEAGLRTVSFETFCRIANACGCSVEVTVRIRPAANPKNTYSISTPFHELKHVPFESNPVSPDIARVAASAPTGD
jgi:transcriptional regulator with XRE-family HTH domain